MLGNHEQGTILHVSLLKHLTEAAIVMFYIFLVHTDHPTSNGRLRHVTTYYMTPSSLEEQGLDFSGITAAYRDGRH